jgi:hypothetical protein
VGRRRSRRAGRGGPARRLVGLQLDWYDIEGAVRRAGPAAGDLADVDRSPCRCSRRARRSARRPRTAGARSSSRRSRSPPSRRATSGPARGSRSSGRSRAAAAGSRAERRGAAVPRPRPQAELTAAIRIHGHAGDPTMTDFSRFDAVVDERLEDWIAELLEFCRIPSEGGDRDSLRRRGRLDGAPAARRLAARVEVLELGEDVPPLVVGELGDGRGPSRRRALRRPAGLAARAVDPRRRTSRRSATTACGPAARPTTRASCCRGSGRSRRGRGVGALPCRVRYLVEGQEETGLRRPRRAARPPAAPPRRGRRAHRGRRARPRGPADGPGGGKGIVVLELVAKTMAQTRTRA